MTSPPEAAPGSPWEPFRTPAFRVLWLTCIVANMAMWMNDVAAAWLMTSIGASPLWVALVQSASTLPLFLLGLPSGTLADLVDRRRYLIATQVWTAALAAVFCCVMWLGAMSAPLLLGLTFAYGIGTAMRWPVLAAVVADAVPPAQIAQAFALNGIAINASRMLGPLIAGALVATWGTTAVFVLNTVLSVVMVFILARWRHEGTARKAHMPMASAMAAGLRYVAQSARMREIVLQIACFAFHATATLALLPLLARRMPGEGAGNFTLLLACMGVGAVCAAVSMPAIRRRLPLRQRTIAGTLAVSASTAAVAASGALWIAVPAMVLWGMAYLLVTNSLTVAAQLTLEGWIRARGIAVYQVALMGASAAGAAAWGQVATWTSVPFSLVAAALLGLAALARPLYGQTSLRTDP